MCIVSFKQWRVTNVEKKKDKFSVLLTEIAKNLDETAEYFVNYKVTNQTTLKEFADTLKEYETKGDNYVHTMIKEPEQSIYHAD